MHTALPPTALDVPSFDMPSFKAGMMAFVPVMVGVIPFGMILGVLMLGVGISPFDAWVMTVALFSGAAHVAVVDLMARDAPVVVIILTGVVINLRFLMYSATLGPVLLGLPAWRKGVLAYMLSDQGFAISTAEFNRPGSTMHKISFYSGAALAMYVTWIAAVTTGILLGAAIPASLQLDFAVPLTFMALLVPAFRNRTHVVAAVVSAVVAVFASDLPWGLGLILASVAGIATGFTLSRAKGEI